MRIVDRSKITDDKGRHIPVARVAPREPDELAARARRKPSAVDADEAGAEPPLRKAVKFKRKLNELSSRVRRLAPPAPGNPEKFLPVTR